MGFDTCLLKSLKTSIRLRQKKEEGVTDCSLFVAPVQHLYPVDMNCILPCSWDRLKKNANKAIISLTSRSPFSLFTLGRATDQEERSFTRPTPAECIDTHYFIKSIKYMWEKGTWWEMLLKPYSRTTDLGMTVADPSTYYESLYFYRTKLTRICSYLFIACYSLHGGHKATYIIHVSSIFPSQHSCEAG